MKQIGYTQDSPPCSSLDIPVSATPICNNASGGSEGGIGAILLVPSSLKHLKSLQTYTYFPGTGGTVTFRARDGEAELTGTYSQQHPWFNGQLTIPVSRSKARCCATLAVSQDRLCISLLQAMRNIHCRKPDVCYLAILS